MLKGAASPTDAAPLLPLATPFRGVLRSEREIIPKYTVVLVLPPAQLLDGDTEVAQRG